MGAAGAAFVGANTVRFSSLPLLDDAYFDMLDNEIFAAIADAVLLPHCGSYWVNTGQIMYIGPGEAAQVLHRDADNWWEYVRSAWPNVVDITISAMIGLEEVTEELGATRVVPGSHTWENLDYRVEHESVPAELGPGDALVYSGYVFHGGGANVTADRWRKAMHLSFVAGWLTPEESCALDFPLGDLDHCSPRFSAFSVTAATPRCPIPVGASGCATSKRSRTPLDEIQPMLLISRRGVRAGSSGCCQRPSHSPRVPA